MRRLLLSSAALCAALAATTADAQTCQGFAAFSSGPLRLGGGMNVGNDQTTIGAGLAFSPRSSNLFVGGILSHTSIDGVDEGAMGYSGEVGYQKELKAGGTAWQLCPVAGIDYLAGPKDIGGTGIDMSAMNFHGGVQIGTRYRTSPAMEIVPTGGLAIAREQTKFSGNVPDPDADTYAVLELGAGFVFNRNLSVLPTIDLPMGLEGSDATFQLVVSYNFLGGSSRPTSTPNKPTRRR